MNNSEDAAFPIVQSNVIGDNIIMDCSSSGLTKREYFAIKCLQGLISNNELHQHLIGNGVLPDEVPRGIAKASLDFADALLTELEAKKSRIRGG